MMSICMYYHTVTRERERERGERERGEREREEREREERERREREGREVGKCAPLPMKE